MQLDIEHFNKLAHIISIVTDAGGSNVTIAGGAVRDSVLEKPIADIDVFYQGELDSSVITSVFGAKEQSTAVTIPPQPILKLGVPDEEFQATLEALEEWEDNYENYVNTFKVESYKGDVFAFEGMKVQLICVEDVDKHIGEFPCYLSRMLFSEGCLVIPIEAIQDASLKIVRFTDECNSTYKNKIELKYEDYL